MSATSPERQIEILAAGAVDLVRREELLEKLRRGRPLVVKAGFDPSAPDIHLGHLVVLRKMRQFQDLGHEVVFVVGDFTARIGDPTGRSRTRPVLTADQIRENAETYRNQACRVLDPARTRLEYNSSWLEPLGSEGWIRLASKMTVARMLERDDFANRLKKNAPISLHELLYPLAQGYDSVALKADIELGGTDQTFNLLVGRDLMREWALEPQVILTTPLLVGLDGTEKMSKSLGNYVAVEEPPATIYGKLMSISDPLMWTYWQTLEGLDGAAVAELRRRVDGGELHPMKLKQDLARRTVASLHGDDAGAAAEQDFERAFRRREVPESVDERELATAGSPIRVSRLLTELGLAPSSTEARRLIAAGAVRIDGERTTDLASELDAGAGRVYELKVGKHRFVRVSFR